VRGDVVEVYLAYADEGIRIHFWGDEIEKIERFDVLNGKTLEAVDETPIYPANIFVTSRETMNAALQAIQEAALVAEPRGILIGLEPHQQYSKSPEGLDRIYNLVKSPAIGINFDTGNAYLCGHDVYAWLEHVAPRLVRLHAKDISKSHSEAERGKVTGTPVGCACGEGELDWSRIIAIVREKCPRDIVFSVECGTPDQAAKSLKHLGGLVA